MKIDVILTKDLKTVTPNTSLPEAQGLFSKAKIRHLPVMEGDKLVGILSLTDIQRLSFGETYGTDESKVDSTLYEMLSVGHVMKSNPRTASPDTTIKEAADIFMEEEFHALPVVKGEELVGIITTTDLIKLLVSEY